MNMQEKAMNAVARYVAEVNRAEDLAEITPNVLAFTAYDMRCFVAVSVSEGEWPEYVAWTPETCRMALAIDAVENRPEGVAELRFDLASIYSFPGSEQAILEYQVNAEIER